MSLANGATVVEADGLVESIDHEPPVEVVGGAEVVNRSSTSRCGELHCSP